jgi:hypothetical protein
MAPTRCISRLYACRAAAPKPTKGNKDSTVPQQPAAAAQQQHKGGSKQPNLKELIKQSKNAKKR